jgi:hypothetical protein
VDAQETIYTFHVTTGDHEIASCEVEIDPADRNSSRSRPP